MGPDGFPRAIPIGLHSNGVQFVLCTVPHAPEVSALHANPKVALTVDTNAFPPHEAQVRAMYKQMARITITPLWAKGLDFQTRFPTPIEQLIHQAR